MPRLIAQPDTAWQGRGVSEQPAISSWRAGQIEVFDHPSGLFGDVARRQYGKSTWLGRQGLKWMMDEAGATVIYVSAKLRLGEENLAKGFETWRDGLRALQVIAAEQGKKLDTNAADDAGEVLDVDALMDLFEHNKLETRLWHDNATYSRSLAIAPNPKTAVGWTGWVILDEVGRMPEFRPMWEDLEPIVSSNPKFKIRMATTPPPDDTHYSYELLAPPPDIRFPVSKRGNWYRSIAGLLCHRLTAHDAWADGIPIYDLETREPLSPEASRARALDKLAWDRNFGCEFIAGGAAALTNYQLATAQAWGAEIGCVAVNWTDHCSDPAALLQEVRAGLARISAHNRVGLGLDVATTDKETSNPSALCVTEEIAPGRYAERALIRFKSASEQFTLDLVLLVLRELIARGIRPVGLGIDASNEVFFAQRVQTAALAMCPVELLKGGEKIEWRAESLPTKVVTGNLYIGLYADNQIAIAPDEFVRKDRRLVKHHRGSLEAETSEDGGHADTFDAGKNATWVLRAGRGPVFAEAVRVGAKGVTPTQGDDDDDDDQSLLGRSFRALRNLISI